MLVHVLMLAADIKALFVGEGMYPLLFGACGLKLNGLLSLGSEQNQIARG